MFSPSAVFNGWRKRRERQISWSVDSSKGGAEFSQTAVPLDSLAYSEEKALRAMEDVVATRAQSAHRPIETTKPVERRPRRGDTWRGTIAKALRGVPSVVSTAQGSLVVEGGWMFVRRDCRTGRSAIRSIEVCPSHVGGRGWLECKREHLRARSTGLRRSTRHRGTGGLRHRRQGCFRSPEVCLRRLSALVGMGRMIRGRGGRFRRSRLG